MPRNRRLVPAQLLEPLQQHPALGLAVAAALISAVLPLWKTRLLPFAELPDHLGRIAAWQRLGDARWHLQDYYATSLWPAPPAAFDTLVRLAAFVLPVESALRLVMSLAAAALPIAVLAFCRRYDRSPWLALFSFPLIYSAALGSGNLPFWTALPVLLFALAALETWLARPSLAGLARWIALSLFIFFLHPLPFVFFALIGGFVISSRARSAGRARLGAAALLCVAAIAALDWILVGQHALAGLGRSLLEEREPLIDGLRGLYNRVLLCWPGNDDDWMLMVLGAAWLLLLTTAREEHVETSASASDAAPRGLGQWVPELAFVLAIALYFALPEHALLTSGLLPCRLLPVAALFGSLLVRGEIAGARLLLFIPVFAVTLAFPRAAERQFVEFERHASGIVRLMRQVPQGTTTSYIQIGDSSDPAVDYSFTPYTDFHAWPQILAGGDDAQRQETPFPLRRISLPRRGPDERTLYREELDYLITRGEPSDGALFKKTEKHPEPSRAVLVASEGPFRLYRTGGSP